MKPSLSCEQQVHLMIRRGLQVNDEAAAIAFLRTSGYYRFSGYARYFQQAPHQGDNVFQSGTSLEDVLQIYEADESLRATLLPALARAEVMLRAGVSRVIADEFSPYGRYLEDAFYTDAAGHEPTAESMRRDVQRSKDRHILRYRNADGDQADYSTLPIWSAVEAWSFGTLSKAIERGDEGKLAAAVASQVGIAKARFPYRVRALVYLRNRCAHHSRLWNHSVLDAGPTPNNVRVKTKRSAGQFEPRSVIDVITSLDDFLVRSRAGTPILPALLGRHGVASAFWKGLTHPRDCRDHGTTAR